MLFDCGFGFGFIFLCRGFMRKGDFIVFFGEVVFGCLGLGGFVSLGMEKYFV